MKYNRLVNAIIILLLVVTLLPAQKAVLARSSADEITRSTPFVPGELVVTFSDGQKAAAYTAQATAIANSIGAAVVAQNGNTALLSASPDADVPQLAGQMATSGQAVSVQPNYIYWAPKAAAAPGGTGAHYAGYTMTSASGKKETLSWDQALALRTVRKVGRHSVATPTFPNEISGAWGWQSIGADIVWPNPASASVYVCLLDTGVDVNQPDLKGNVISGYDYVNDDKVPADDNGHGTAVAGVIMGKLNSGAGSAAGVYNGKLYAVKVLNSQGYGTSFAIAAGITSCANQKSVKVINMSFAAPEGTDAVDLLEYNALYKAYKAGKLLVAAAGNDSTSVHEFPAAWADADVDPPTGFNCTGTTPCPAGNLIAPGMISVASARAPGEAPIWVEDSLHDGLTDNDTVVDDSALCATSDTNYGDWITLVAPGEDILTSTPTSAPFSLNVTDGVPAGYSTFTGTSLAAGFVAGAAARYYSVTGNLTKTNLQVKNKLIATGDGLSVSNVDKMNYANDVGGQSGWDHTLGYNQSTGYLWSYGDTFDTDGDPDTTDDVYTYAPFCWPGWDPNGSTPAGGWTSQENMWNARYVNVARAMDRFAVEVYARDATTGLPLTGATVQAAQTTISAVKDKAVVGSDPRVLLINLPVDPTGTYDMHYFLQVTKTGYTTGVQNFNKIDVPHDDAGSTYLVVDHPENVVSVPPSTNMNVVLDWQNPDEETHPNLDMYLWLPKSRNYLGLTGGAGGGGIIGHDTLPASYPHGIADLPGALDASDLRLHNGDNSLYLGAGTLQPATAWGDTNTSHVSPYAIHNFNGGLESEPGSGKYYAPVESVTIKANAAALKTTPFAKPYYITGTDIYTVVITDNSQSGGDIPIVAPVVRIWSKGNLVRDPAATTTNPLPLLIEPQCSGPWWQAVKIDGSQTDVSQIITQPNICGDDIAAFQDTGGAKFYGSVEDKP